VFSHQQQKGISPKLVFSHQQQKGISPWRPVYSHQQLYLAINNKRE
jgi:hypothetical protein